MVGAHSKLNKSATLGADKAATHLDALTRAYGRALRGAGRRAAARFRQTETLTAAVNPAPPDWTPPTADELIDQEELAADTERKTGKLHRLMLVSSAQTALEPFGIAFDVHAPTSQVVLDQFAQRIQATITSAISEQVTEAIQSGYAAGRSVAQVSSAIQQATDAISKPRADMLARSDLNGLANSGSLLAASMSGASSTKTWLATEDDRTRETHSDADGQTVAIDDTFDVGGEALQYPGDPAASWEETANCRCVIVYGEPLTASAGAVPTDFASWSDHAWEGDPVANRPVSAVTSGGTMSDLNHDTELAATGDTSLPLSERDRAWDAGEATGRVKKWASSDGSGDPGKIDYGKLAKAFFWQDTAGEGGAKIGDFKLPFADVIGGKLTAVWRGVTAGAQRLSSTDGVDKPAVQKKMSSYYSKAASTYKDESIKPPWASGSHAVDGEALAAHRAFLADHGADVLEDDEIRAYTLLHERLTGAPVELELTDVALLAAGNGGTPWTATLCVAGVPTVDNGVKRLLAEDGGSWLPLPLPLGLMDDSPHADVITRAPICGRIDSIVPAGNVYQASGVFFDASDDANVAAAGSKAAALVSEMGRMGVSVDLVDSEVELMVYDASEVSEMDDYDVPNDPIADGDGISVDVEPVPVAVIEDDLEYVMVFTRWVIAGATVCPVQALAPQATISVVASALTAAAAGMVPVDPPAEWFDEPEHSGPTPLTVTDDGQVYGHLALWGTCHTGKPGVCVTAPRSPSSYRQFHRGQVKTDQGDRIDVGVLTMNTGHASLRMNASATVAHYDDTGTQGAHVRATDGQHGIWLAGALNPKLSAEDARLLMASAPSGDWRELVRGDGLDLFGVLAVNVPGFPVPRAQARLVASGAEMERVALVAAGVLEPGTVSGEEFARQLAVLAASADGIEGLAALAAA